MTPFTIKAKEALKKGYMLRVTSNPSGDSFFASYIDKGTSALFGHTVCSSTLEQAIESATDSLP